MSKQGKINRLPLSAWHAERLRLTAFPITATPPQNISWWTELMGEPAETKTVQPKLDRQTEQGLFLGAKLVNQVQPNRIDWLIQLTDQESEAISFPTIGPFLEVIEPFVELMLRWFKLKTCPELKRLAFGPILVYPVDSRVAGYRQLSVYLPSIKLDHEGSSDFFYQINRIRNSTSKSDGFKINRLSKWSVSAVQRMDFSIGKEIDLSVTKRQAYYACRLDLDINTAAEFPGPLPKKQLSLIFQELVDLAKEIALEGDVP